MALVTRTNFIIDINQVAFIQKTQLPLGVSIPSGGMSPGGYGLSIWFIHNPNIGQLDFNSERDRDEVFSEIMVKLNATGIGRTSYTQ